MGGKIFQFHKGAIRTRAASGEWSNLYDFNSIKVRLEHVVDLSLNAFDNYFNSIKVRLELPISISFISISIFQFHKGAIRT